MTRANAVPARVSLATDEKIREGIFALLRGEIEATDEKRRAVSEYMAECKKARLRMERSA